MSRIYFHSPSDDVEVLGRERAWLGGLTDNVGLSMLTGHTLFALDEWLTFNIFDKTVREYGTHAAAESTVKLAFRHTDDKPVLTYQDIVFRPWDITLNTVMRLGSPALQLAARIHATCEIHGWVDGANRAWLADIIEAGIRSGVFRSMADYDPGWHSVASFLRANDVEPVVMSYSVCDNFPAASASTWEPAPGDADGDGWYDLDDTEQWRLGMEYLRQQSGFLEIEPAGYADHIFGYGGLTWMDLIAGQARLCEVLDLAPA